MDLAIESIAKSLSLSCYIIYLKYVLISFSFQKLFSPDATFIDVVILILKAMKTLENAENLLFSIKYSNSS